MKEFYIFHGYRTFSAILCFIYHDNVQIFRLFLSSLIQIQIWIWIKRHCQLMICLSLIYLQRISCRNLSCSLLIDFLCFSYDSYSCLYFHLWLDFYSYFCFDSYYSFSSFSFTDQAKKTLIFLIIQFILKRLNNHSSDQFDH